MADTYPSALRRSVDLLLQRERTRHGDDRFVCVLRDHSIDRGLAAATPIDTSRDRITDALHGWPRPRPRLPDTVATVADAVLVGYLAVQAACEEAGLPAPAVGDLDPSECEREAHGWRLGLRRPDATGYLAHRRPGTPELALAATVWMSEHTVTRVAVVSQRDVTKANRAYLERAVSIARQLRPHAPAPDDA